MPKFAKKKTNPGFKSGMLQKMFCKHLRCLQKFDENLLIEQQS